MGMGARKEQEREGVSMRLRARILPPVLEMRTCKEGTRKEGWHGGAGGCLCLP